MKTFIFEDPQRGQISYQDHNRHLWLIAVLFPLFPLLSMSLMDWTGQTWVLWIPFIFLYVFIPLLDQIFPNDRSNPPEQIVPQLEADNYYRLLNLITVPLHFLILITGAWFVASYDLDWSGLLALGLTVGVVSGFGINIGHELGHKKNALDRMAARWVLAVAFYGHFNIEHNVGHHTEVATPEDTASARFGESIYRFALREVPGGLRRAWRLEGQRLERRGFEVWSIHNQVLQSWLISIVLFAGLIIAFGVIVVPLLLIQTAWAWWQLTSANYVEHYGLLREKLPNGKYERCRPQHSWNANHMASNILTFNLERHSDHHAFAARRYQSLRHFDDVPQLPNGYFGMFMLAYVPFLWRKVMDPKVLQWAGGDMSKINVNSG